MAIYSQENSNTELKLKTQNAGVRTFAISDDSTLVCIADDCSAILIYSLKSSLSAIGKTFISCDLESRIKDISAVAQVRSFFTVGFKLSWLPHKNILAVAVPSSNGVTTIIYRKGGKKEFGSEQNPVWEEVYLTTSSSSKLTHGSNDVNLAVFSPNGRYLATSDCSGMTIIWDVVDLNAEGSTVSSDSFSPISAFESTPSGPLYDLVWGVKDGDNYIRVASPVASSIVEDVIDVKGGRCMPTGPVKYPKAVVSGLAESQPTITQTKSYVPYRSAENAALSARVSPQGPIPAAPSASLSAEQSKPSRLSKKISAVVDDDDDDNVIDDTERIEIAAPLRRNVDESDNDDAMDEDDGIDDTGNTQAIANITRLAEGRDAPPPRMSEANLTAIAAMVAASTKADKALVQPPFQPSSTTYDEKRRRFMVWNSIGNITCSDLGINNRIEIRFTSTDRNKPEAFNDNFGFTMAALSYEGAVFASDPEEDFEDSLSKTRGSTVFYHAFPGQQHMRGANEVRPLRWHQNCCRSISYRPRLKSSINLITLYNLSLGFLQTFTVNLNSGESALAVAVGEGWVAVATSSGLLRMFSSTGIPLALTVLRGPIIAMVGYIHQLSGRHITPIPLS